jgi:hypothetical protein
VPGIVCGDAIRCGLALQSPHAGKRRWTSPLWQRDCAIVALARLFWRFLDALDYWLMQTRLWIVDAVCGPFPDDDTPD